MLLKQMLCAISIQVYIFGKGIDRIIIYDGHSIYILHKKHVFFLQICLKTPLICIFGNKSYDKKYQFI